MMDAIAVTLSRMHSLYRGFPRHLLDTGVYLALFSLIVGLVSHVLVAIVAWNLEHIPFPEYDVDLSSYLWNATQMDYHETTQAFGILVIALFATCLLYQPELLRSKTGFRIWISSFPKKAAQHFLFGWMLLFVLHLIFYAPPFNTLQELDVDFAASERRYQLMEWFNLFSNTVIHYAVYPIALWLIERQAQASSLGSTRERGLLYLTVLVLAIGLRSIYNTFYYLVAAVLAPPLLIPFGSSALATVIGLIILLASLSIAIPALMILFVTPVEFFRSTKPVEAAKMEDDGV
jgi:hypothetical protein